MELQKRPDTDLITEALRLKIITMKEAMEWMRLPFITIPDIRGQDTDVEFREFVAKQTEKGVYGKTAIVSEFLTNDFYFDEFIVQVEGEIVRIAKQKEQSRVLFSMLPNDLRGYKREHWMSSFYLKTTMVDDKPHLDLIPATELLRKRISELGKIPEMRKSLDAMVENGKTISGYCTWFCDYNNQKHKYLIEVGPERKPGKKKGSGLATPKEIIWQAAGPRLLYLDKLPTSGSNEGVTETEEGDVRVMRPHQRRGYWVTLRADRFRDHPKYMVKNGVYRKPCWIGPKEAVVNGNVYRVLE